MREEEFGRPGAAGPFLTGPTIWRKYMMKKKILAAGLAAVLALSLAVLLAGLLAALLY